MTTLEEKIRSTFKAGFSYSGVLSFARGSGVSIGGNTFSEYIKDLLKTTKFYDSTNDQYELKYTKLVCNTCSGSGQINDGVYKQGPYKGKPSLVKCKDCSGIGKVNLE